MTTFLGITAASAFFLAAVLLPIQEWSIGIRYQEALLVAGSVSLGMLLWRTRAGLEGRVSRLLVRVGAVLMMGIILVLASVGWPSAILTATVVLATASVILGLGGLIEMLSRRGLGAWTGSSFLLLALALGVCFAWDVTRGVSLVLGAYALLAVRLGIADSLTLRRTVAAVIGGVAIVAVLALATAVTSPWFDHDGYSLACGGVDRVACTRLADRVATTVRAQDPKATITHMEVAADRTVDVCWYGELAMGAGCWFTDPM